MPRTSKQQATESLAQITVRVTFKADKSVSELENTASLIEKLAVKEVKKLHTVKNSGTHVRMWREG